MISLQSLFSLASIASIALLGGLLGDRVGTRAR